MSKKKVKSRFNSRAVKEPLEGGAKSPKCGFCGQKAGHITKQYPAGPNVVGLINFCAACESVWNVLYAPKPPAGSSVGIEVVQTIGDNV